MSLWVAPDPIAAIGVELNGRTAGPGWVDCAAADFATADGRVCVTSCPSGVTQVTVDAAVTAYARRWVSVAAPVSLSDREMSADE